MGKNEIDVVGNGLPEDSATRMSFLDEIAGVFEEVSIEVSIDVHDVCLTRRQSYLWYTVLTLKVLASEQ